MGQEELLGHHLVLWSSTGGAPAKPLQRRQCDVVVRSPSALSGLRGLTHSLPVQGQ